MIKEIVKPTDEYNFVLDSIQKNYHILEDYIPGRNERPYYKYNNRILLSNSNEFLEAVKNDLGGEIILDSAIGPFLFFGDNNID